MSKALVFKNTGRKCKPWSVQHVQGSRDDDDNLTVTWIRRSRIGGEWVDYIDVPLGEMTEAYEIDVMNGNTVLRTLTSSEESVAYTAVEQAQDGLTPGDPVTVQIYQMSSLVGRGFMCGATI